MHQFKSGDYIMVKNHESERWTHGCVDVERWLKKFEQSDK